MRCSHCTTTNEPTAITCASCGEPISQTPVVVIPEEFYAAAIGPKNQAYYLRVFKHVESQSAGKFTWNWAAFFFTFCWFLYRKMWRDSVIYLFFPYLIVVCIGIIFHNTIIVNFVSMYLIYWGAIYIVPGMFGNMLYFNHCTKKIQKARAASDDVKDQLAEISAKGGTSKVIVYIGVVVAVILISIIVSVAIPGYQRYTSGARLTDVTTLGKRGFNSSGLFAVTETAVALARIPNQVLLKHPWNVVFQRIGITGN